MARKATIKVTKDTARITLPGGVWAYDRAMPKGEDTVLILRRVERLGNDAAFRIYTTGAGRPPHVPDDAVRNMILLHEEDGVTLGEIANLLNESGVPRARSNQAWTARDVHKVLNSKQATRVRAALGDTDDGEASVTAA